MLAAISCVNIESLHKVYTESTAETLNNTIVVMEITNISSLKYLNTKLSNTDVSDVLLLPDSMLSNGTSEDNEISSKDAEEIIKNCNF